MAAPVIEFVLAAVDLAGGGVPGVGPFAGPSGHGILEIGFPCAVIAHEDDISVVTEPEGFHPVQEASDEFVHVVDEVRQAGLAPEPAVVGGFNHGPMRQQFVVDDEEGFSLRLRPAHPLDHVFDQDIRPETVGDVLADLAVLVVGGVPMAIGFRALVPDLPGAPGFESRFADVTGVVLEGGELPFSGKGGAVAVRADQLREGGHLLEIDLFPGAVVDGKHRDMAMAVRVEAGVQADP